MTRVDRVVRVLLKRNGQLFSEALGLDLRPGSASVLFQWLCASLLLGGRIRATAAQQAAGALLRQGWTTAEKMAASTWEERTRLLNRSGYARYDESTSRRLGDWRSYCSIVTGATFATSVRQHTALRRKSAACSRSSKASATSASTSFSARFSLSGTSSTPSPIGGRCTPQPISASATTPRRREQSLPKTLASFVAGPSVSCTQSPSPSSLPANHRLLMSLPNRSASFVPSPSASCTSIPAFLDAVPPILPPLIAIRMASAPTLKHYLDARRPSLPSQAAVAAMTPKQRATTRRLAEPWRAWAVALLATIEKVDSAQ